MKMNQHENAAIVVGLVKRLGEKSSWCGATHLQKTAYFLKELAGVPLDFDFVLYKHGPFSFELQNEISHLVANDLLDLRPNDPPYGPSLAPGGRENLLMDRYGSAADRYAREIEAIAEHLADKGVVELERLGTALWVTREMTGGATTQERAERVHELKPHVAVDQVVLAVEEVDALTVEWNCSN